MRARIYTGDLPRYSRDEQIMDCEKAIAALDERPSFDPRHVYGPRQLDAFVRDVSGGRGRASASIAVLPRLRALDERPANEGAGNAFHSKLRRLTRAALYIVDAETGRTSKDADWDAYVDKVALQVSKGHYKPTRTKAQEMAKLSHAAREKDLVAHWDRKDGDEEYERVLLHWQNISVSALIAIERAPPEAGDLNTASRKTWERIFGGRTPASKTYKSRARKKKASAVKRRSKR